MLLAPLAAHTESSVSASVIFGHPRSRACCPYCGCVPARAALVPAPHALTLAHCEHPQSTKAHGKDSGLLRFDVGPCDSIKGRPNWSCAVTGKAWLRPAEMVADRACFTPHQADVLLLVLAWVHGLAAEVMVLVKGPLELAMRTRKDPSGKAAGEGAEAEGEGGDSGANDDSLAEGLGAGEQAALGGDGGRGTDSEGGREERDDGFTAAQSFAGSRPGKVFKAGASGLGYYPDP